MKKLLLFALAIFCVGTSTEAQRAEGSPLEVNMEAQTQPGGGTFGKAESHILVAYFSWSGNARALAGQVAEETGGDLFEIKTAASYPDTYNECIALAKEEQQKNVRPALAAKVENMAQYRTVFLCYPNWWGTLPMGVFTFLESYDFSGKTIYPLVTHGGSRFGRSLDDIKKLCPKTTLGEGVSVSAFDTNPKDSTRVTPPNRDVTAWLRRLGAAQ